MAVMVALGLVLGVGAATVAAALTWFWSSRKKESRPKGVFELKYHAVSDSGGYALSFFETGAEWPAKVRPMTGDDALKEWLANEQAVNGLEFCRGDMLGREEVERLARPDAKEPPKKKGAARKKVKK